MTVRGKEKQKHPTLLAFIFQADRPEAAVKHTLLCC
jgi:hypothetical protein